MVLGLEVDKALAIALAGVILGVVCTILRSNGLRVQLSACTFILSLVATQLLIKELSSQPLSYRFPATVTLLHFLTVWLVCVVYWAWVGNPRKLLPGSLGSRQRYFAHILPIACSLPLSVIFNNQGLVYIGAGLSAICGTMAPVCTALLSHCLGRRVARRAWIGVLMAVTGAVVIAKGELSSRNGGGASGAVLPGLSLSFAAVLLRALKAVLQDKLLAPSAYAAPSSGVSSDEALEAGGQALPPFETQALTPMHVWALQAPPCALAAACVALSAENPVDAWRLLTPASAMIILCSCVSASTLNILGMMTIKDLGASSMQIIGKLNTIITVSVSVAFFGEELPSEVVGGTCLLLMGVAVFERAETASRKDKAKLSTLKI